MTTAAVNRDNKSLGQLITCPQRHDGDKLVIPEYEDILQSMRDDGFGEHIGKSNEAEQILFYMYGRNYLPYERDRRIQELKMMIDDSDENKVRDRALRFIKLEGDKALDDDTNNANDCNDLEFLQEYKAGREQWKKLSMEYGVEEQEKRKQGEKDHWGWNAFTGFGSRWIQRVQPAGSCFLHAPVVLQSLLVRSTVKREAIDISKYARASFGCEKISRLIVADAGGDSKEELENMLEWKTVTGAPIEESLTAPFNCNCHHCHCPVTDPSNCNCPCRCPSRLFHYLQLFHCGHRLQESNCESSKSWIL
jgi:hypothetical protein